LAKSKPTTPGTGVALARPPVRKKARRKRQPAREEQIGYIVRVSDWDYYYSFRPSDPKGHWDHGPYSEIATLSFTGELIRPENSKYRTATVTLSGKAGMMEERLTGAALSIGTLSAHENELSAYIFVPAERLAELTTVAQSGRVQIVHITGTRLRYRSAQMSDARRQAGLTQRDLAERLGKPPSFVAKVETGERRLDLVEFVAIARALNLSPAEFIGRVDAAMPGKIEI